MYHIPVLLEQVIAGLEIQPDGTYVDATFGGGGHSRAILDQLTTGRLLAFDQDPDAVKNQIEDERFVLINQNFRFLKNFLRYHNAIPVNGMLADLGVSSHQLDTAARGFSTRFEGQLDMRMEPGQKTTAADIVNNYPEPELKNLFKEYGEIKNSHQVARAIVTTRDHSPITTTAGLVNVVSHCFPARKLHKSLAMIFQALRIAVNDELNALKSMLRQTPEILGKGGRLVVISYHSLEDRIVKNFIRSGNFDGNVEKDFYGNPLIEFKAVNSKPIEPDEGEIRENPRARSAKMRIAEKI